MADGNGVGDRSKKWRQTGERKDFFAREAHGERFFHSMRVAVRKALVGALAETFGAAAERIRTAGEGRLPFRLMMLGGDDLLLVCDAAHALPFVKSYAEELGKWPLADGDPLDVGIGVAVVKKTFPFYRSHALAEQLAASAKRLYRGRQGVGSTVDWLSISEAWHEDVAAVRRRDFVRTYALDVAGNKVETLILSRRPYPVLGNGLSLAALLDGAGNAVGRLPRSQLMALADGIDCGRRQAEWAVRLLGEEPRGSLQPALANGTPFDHLGNQTYATALLDFLEVFELEREREGQGQKEPEMGGE